MLENNNHLDIGKNPLKTFAVRYIEEIILDYVRNLKEILKHSENARIANTENAEVKTYLLIDTDKPILSLVSLALGVNQTRLSKQLLVIFSRIDEQAGVYDE